MKTLLIFPPQINPIHPHLAIPLLKGYLEGEGITVEIIDANVMAYDQLLTKKYLQLCKHRLKKMKKRNKAQKLALIMSDYLVDNIENSKKQIRNRAVLLDLQNYTKHARMIKYALHLISSAFPGETLSLTQYKPKYGTNNPKKMLKNLNEESIFSKFNESIIKQILKTKPTLVGFSIVLIDQLVPAFDLAKKIKEKHKNIKIVFGGTTITRLAKDILKNELYFKYVDFYIEKEGEIPLQKLINTIKNNSSLEEVPGLLWHDKKITRNGSVDKQILLKDLPTPNFDGYPLNLYLSPEKVLPTIFSRNCYWNKCTFCDICEGYNKLYRIKGIKKTIEELCYFKKEYGVNYFRFVDEAIHPSYLKQLADKLINKKVNWETACRLEKDFKDKDFCNLLNKAGCQFLSFGLESGSQKIIDLMNKGYKISDVKKILSSTTKAGIANHIYLMTDFPGETNVDFKKTIQLVLQNKNNIFSFQISKFMLTKKSKISNYYCGKKTDPGTSSLNYKIKHTKRAETLKIILQKNLPNYNVGQELIGTHKMIYNSIK